MVMTRGARAATMLTLTSQHRGRARKPRTNDAINLKAEIRSVVVLWWRHAVMRWNERLRKIGHGSDNAMCFSRSLG